MRPLFGYCAALELCARELQSISWAGFLFPVQYPHARAFDGSLMLGACVAGKEEVGEIGGRRARIEIDGQTVLDAPLAWTAENLVEWISSLSKRVTLEPGTLLVPGSADEVVVQPARSGELPVELVNRARPRSDLLRPGARVTMMIEGIDFLMSTVRHIAREDVTSEALHRQR